MTQRKYSECWYLEFYFSVGRPEGDTTLSAETQEELGGFVGFFQFLFFSSQLTSSFEEFFSNKVINAVHRPFYLRV